MAPVTAHEFNWSAEAVMLSIGTSVPRRLWYVRLLSGETTVEESDVMGSGRTRRPLDYFLVRCPPDHFSRIVRLTFVKLDAHRLRETTVGENFRITGIRLLCTRYEFGSRSENRSTTARNEYIPAPGCSQLTGTSRDRFNWLWSCITYSEE